MTPMLIEANMSDLYNWGTRSSRVKKVADKIIQKYMISLLLNLRPDLLRQIGTISAIMLGTYNLYKR
jgi:hypothetical protein